MMESSNYWYCLMVMFVSIPCVLVASSLVNLMYSLWWKPKRLEKYLHEHGIRGPPYKFMYGNAKEMMELSKQAKSKPLGFSHDILPRADAFHLKMMTQYGKVFVTWMGPKPQVVADHMLIKEILLNKSGDFLKMENTPSFKLFLSGLTTYDGEKWALHRKIISPAFHMEKLKIMMSAFSACCDELPEKWDEMVATEGSCELDISPEFEMFSGNVLSRAAFGSSYEEGRKVYKLQIEQGQFYLQELYQKPSIFLGFLPAKINPRRVEIDKEVRSVLEGIIKKKEKAMETGDGVSDDLLGIMMESNLNESRESGSSKKPALSMDDVIEERKLYIAGQETTAKLLTWTMVALSMHSSWQDQAREEVLQVMGKNKPKFEDLQHLKIMNMILYEVLRLYPPTAIIRRTRKETKLGDFSLPPNFQIMLALHHLHRDPEQWGDDANEFNPSRFSEGVANASKDQVSYYPFGGGQRICIGQNFALMEAKMALAKILQHFYFELSPFYTHAPYIYFYSRVNTKWCLYPI